MDVFTFALTSEDQEAILALDSATGRMGYDPQCDPEVWKHEFRERFGPCAEDVEAAYRSASHILPLITDN